MCTGQAEQDTKCWPPNDQHTPLNIRAIEGHCVLDQSATDTALRWVVCSRTAIVYRSEDKPLVSRHCIRLTRRRIDTTSARSIPLPKKGITMQYLRMLQICSCCNSCPEFVEPSVVFENLVVLVYHLGVQRLVHTFLILTLLCF